MRNRYSRGDEWIQKITGSPPVDPGHPLTVASQIMAVYPGPREAFAADVRSDERITGSDPQVGHAIGLLERAIVLGENALDIIDSARQQWQISAAVGSAQALADGQAQADKVRPHFYGQIECWISDWQQCPFLPDQLVRVSADTLGRMRKADQARFTERTGTVRRIYLRMGATTPVVVVLWDKRAGRGKQFEEHHNPKTLERAS